MKRKQQRTIFESLQEKMTSWSNDYVILQVSNKKVRRMVNLLNGKFRVLKYINVGYNTNVVLSYMTSQNWLTHCLSTRKIRWCNIYNTLDNVPTSNNRRRHMYFSLKYVKHKKWWQHKCEEQLTSLI